MSINTSSKTQLITFILNETEHNTNSMRKAAIVLGVNVSSLSRYLAGKSRGGRKLKDVVFIHPILQPYVKADNNLIKS